MNKSETLMIFTLLSTAYPHAYKDFTKQQVDATVVLWQQMFSDTPVEKIKAAIQTHIANCKYAPTIAEIKYYIAMMDESEQPSALKAWQNVRRAVQHGEYKQGGYDYTRAFNELPELAKRVLGDKYQLRVYAQMNEEIFENFERPRFIANFDKQAKAQAEFGRLPGIVQAEIHKLSESKRIPLQGLLDEARQRTEKE